MSASEKLKALQQLADGPQTYGPEALEYEEAAGCVMAALPQIRAVVEAAQNAEGWMVAVRKNELETFLQVPLGEWLPVVTALAALDEVLTTRTEPRTAAESTK